MKAVNKARKLKKVSNWLILGGGMAQTIEMVPSHPLPGASCPVIWPVFSETGGVTRVFQVANKGNVRKYKIKSKNENNSNLI
jgi:hypothetical protein